MTMRNVGFRLQTDGKAEVKNDFAEVKRAGQDAMDGVADAAEEGARRATAANDQFTERQLAAFKRQAAQAKVAVAQAGAQSAFGAVAANVGSGPQPAIASMARSTGAARESAAVFEEAARAEERMADAAIKLRAALDPAFAAQNRFNREMGEARALVGAGAISLDEYVAKLRLERAALESNSVAHGRVASGAMANRMAMQGASYQVQDFITQVSMGANPINAFAVQGAQLAGQFSSVEGKAGAVARFFMGPWGLAITAGTMVLAPFAAKLWEQDEASKAAAEATKKHREAVLALADAQNKAIQTAERKQAVDVATIQIEMAGAIATRNRTQAELVRAQTIARIAAEEARSGSFSAEEAVQKEADAKRADARVTELAEQARKNAAELARLESGVNAGIARLIAMKVDAQSTPEGRIRADYERRRSAAMGDPNLAGEANAPKLAAKLRELNTERDRELKLIEQSTKVKRDSETATPASVAKMLREALPGVQVTSTTGGQHVKGSDHYAKRAIDFVPAGGMGSMTKDDVRQLFEGRGLQIRKNAQGVEQLFGPGDKGHSDHWHVAWTKGKLALDDYSDAAKRAKERTQELLGLSDRFDPAGAAIRSYREEMAKIASFEKSGDIDAATADQYRAGALRAKLRVTNPEVFAPIKGTEKFVEDSKEREQADERRAAYVKDRLADQRDTLGLLEREGQLVGANDNLRTSELNKLELILDLKRRNIEAESEEGRAILANAAAIDEKTARLKVQAAAVDELRGFGAQFVDTVLSEDTWSSWGNAGKTILNELKSEFIKLALLNPLKNLINGDNKLPTLTSAIAGIGKLFNPGKNAAGTHNWAGGLTWVNENGPEIADLPSGTRIYPAAETRRMMEGANDNRGGASFHFDLRGAVVTEDLISQMNAIGAGAATRGAAGGASMAGRNLRIARKRALA